LAPPLAASLEQVFSAERDLLQADWIVPAPLHPKRKRERGFDQTLLLARLLSASLRIPVFSGLQRIRHTAPQFGLDHEERTKNVRGAFALSGGEKISGGTILVLDDVMTTGATINEICRLLHEGASPKRIVALTVARVSLTRF
jgi:ComF family protein